jgi:hypothetical protein
MACSPVPTVATDRIALARMSSLAVVGRVVCLAQHTAYVERIYMTSWQMNGCLVCRIGIVKLRVSLAKLGACLFWLITTELKRC